MGEVSVRLKRGFYTLAVVIGITSTLLLAATLFEHGFFHQTDETGDILAGIVVQYVLGVSTLLMAVCGVYGCYTGRRWALMVFTVGMTVASLTLFVESVNGFQSGHEVEVEVEAEHLAMMPLSDASAEDKAGLYNLQINWECCGLVEGYQDWGLDIPLSCACPEELPLKCVEVISNSSFFSDGVSEEDLEEHSRRRLVYQEPCLPVLLHSVKVGVMTIIGILFGLTLLWMVGVAVGVAVLHQMRRKTAAVPTVTFTPAPKPGRYAELYNAPDVV